MFTQGACDVLIIDYDKIYSLFKADTKVFAVLALNLARLLTKRLKASGEVISELQTEIREIVKAA